MNSSTVDPTDMPERLLRSAQDAPCQRAEPDLAQDFDRIDELLEAVYRSGALAAADPLAAAVYLLVSDRSKVDIGRRVFAQLRRCYPRWRKILFARNEDIEELLRPTGNARRKTRQLKALLARVREANDSRPSPGRRRDLNLDFINTMARSEAEKFLVALRGTAKTATRAVLSRSLGHEASAIDTNVTRIFNRMGLASQKNGHDVIDAAVPPRFRNRLHLNLVHHGRAVCRSAEKPRCGDCVLVSFCQQGRKTVGANATAGTTAAKKPAPVAIDLFGGAGGLGYGFGQAGFRILLAVEGERSAAQTYRLNNPGTVVVEMEIDRGTTGTALLSIVPGVQKIEALLAGPPCQGYSIAGWRRPDDPKNYLFQHVVRIAGEIGVQVVAMENVPGMKNVGGRSLIDAVKEAFRQAGFKADHYLLRASDFGVPQHRRRIFFLARRPSLPPIGEPRATHLRHGEARRGGDQRPPTPTVLEVLDPLPRLGPARNVEWTVLKDAREFGNLSTMNHSESVREKIRRIRAGNGPISYRRLHPAEARTVVAGHRALPVHPTLHRTISVREAASIQGFPVAYFFCGYRSQQPLQVAKWTRPN